MAGRLPWPEALPAETAASFAVPISGAGGRGRENEHPRDRSRRHMASFKSPIRVSALSSNKWTVLSVVSIGTLMSTLDGLLVSLFEAFLGFLG